VTGPALIASVVEGHGEVRALPILLRRIAGEIYHRHQVVVTPPHRVGRSQMVKGDVLRRAVQLQCARVVDGGGVLLVLDADDDCAVQLGEQLRADVAPALVHVVVAVREFESWFLAAAPALAGHRLIRAHATFTGDPEMKRDAKGELNQLMTERYRATLHQSKFAAAIDLAQAGRARSFRRLVTCVGRLLGAERVSW